MTYLNNNFYKFNENYIDWKYKFNICVNKGIDIIESILVVRVENQFHMILEHKSQNHYVKFLKLHYFISSKCFMVQNLRKI